jgi:hypothetical protein
MKNILFLSLFLIGFVFIACNKDEDLPNTPDLLEGTV